MKINFNEMQAKTLPAFKGGEGSAIMKMYTDDLGKIMQGRLEPGSSIGMHTHDTSSEIIYILSGNGRVLYDDTEETLVPGECHYCPKGHTHSLINSGKEDLLFFAVVPEQ
ncbi:MAG: cupin domain-containing protein [Roseburia sp.]